MLLTLCRLDQIKKHVKFSSQFHAPPWKNNINHKKLKVTIKFMAQ